MCYCSTLHPKGLCPTGWTDVGPRCYKRFAITANHESVGQTCQAEGAWLAVFTDLTENNNVAAALGFVQEVKRNYLVLGPFSAQVMAG